MIDCHLHLQDERLWKSRMEIVDSLRERGVKKLVVNGTCPGDWGRVAELAETFNEVVPFFGLHPWKINDVGDGWEALQRRHLESYLAAGVGEIGLDKWIRDHDIEKQKVVFSSQLKLAAELNRPITIHCLQAWGHLLECLRDTRISSPFLLHSFGGPIEMLPDFIELGAYFSLSGYFFRPDKKEKLEVFREVPEDRILLETDAPDMMPPTELVEIEIAPDVNHPASLVNIYRAYASWCGDSELEVARRLKTNAESWYLRS